MSVLKIYKIKQPGKSTKIRYMCCQLTILTSPCRQWDKASGPKGSPLSNVLVMLSDPKIDDTDDVLSVGFPSSWSTLF